MAWNREKRRRVPPIPLEWMIDEPAVIALPAAGLGILTRIVIHFWTTECAPLPESDSELAIIARAHRPTFINWRKQIRAILADQCPKLSIVYFERKRRIDNLKQLGVKGGSILALRAMERKRARAAREAGADPVTPRKRAVEVEPAAAPVIPEKRGGWTD